jgi:hypothetical protein
MLTDPNTNPFAAAWDTTSQAGEDGVIAAIFDRIGWPNYSLTAGLCIECGAGDGRTNSNTWRLIAELGWDSLQIEADPQRYATLCETHRDRPGVICLQARVAPGPVGGLDDYLAAADALGTPDLLVIDVDGCDWWLWHHIHRYHPRLVMVEFNPTMPFWLDVKQPADPRIQAGCSLGALIALGQRKGYELAAVTHWNALFVRAADYPALGLADNSPWTIARHLTQGYSLLWQDYAGRVAFAGNIAHVWGPPGHIPVAAVEAAANAAR